MLYPTLVCRLFLKPLAPACKVKLLLNSENGSGSTCTVPPEKSKSGVQLNFTVISSSDIDTEPTLIWKIQYKQETLLWLQWALLLCYYHHNRCSSVLLDGGCEFPVSCKPDLPLIKPVDTLAILRLVNHHYKMPQPNAHQHCGQAAIDFLSRIKDDNNGQIGKSLRVNRVTSWNNKSRGNWQVMKMKLSHRISLRLSATMPSVETMKCQFSERMQLSRCCVV